MSLLVGTRRALLTPPTGLVLTLAERVARYGLVSAWNLNEASGQRDDAYGANHLTDVNTVTAAVAKLGANAAQFTAANSEYLSRADNADLSGGAFDMWWGLWVLNDNETAQHAFLAKFNATTSAQEYEINYLQTTDRFRLIGSTTGAANVAVSSDTFGALAIATWYFIFCYHENGVGIGISVNGGAFDVAALPGGIFNGTAVFALGARTNTAPGNFHQGALDAVAFGKSPPLGISALKNEIRDYLFNGGVGREYPWAA